MISGRGISNWARYALIRHSVHAPQTKLRQSKWRVKFSSGFCHLTEEHVYVLPVTMLHSNRDVPPTAMSSSHGPSTKMCFQVITPVHNCKSYYHTIYISYVLTIVCKCVGTLHCEPWLLRAGRRVGSQKDNCLHLDLAGSHWNQRHGRPPPRLLRVHRQGHLLQGLSLWQGCLPSPVSVLVHVHPIRGVTAPLYCADVPSLEGRAADSGQYPMSVAQQEHWGLPEHIIEHISFWHLSS